MATVGFFDSQRDSLPQLDAFNSEHCAYIYHDESTLFDNAQEGDVVVVESLSCAGHDLAAALGFVHRLTQHGLGFVFVADGLDTRVSQDLPGVMEAMYQLVLNQGRGGSEGPSDTPKAAPARHGGRGRAPIAPEVIDEALARYQRGDAIKDICGGLGLSQGTLYRYVRERGVTRQK